jgi:Zn-dependent protease with chaperone function
MGEGKSWQCPKCQAVIPVVPMYTTWCDQCGWNLQPYAPEAPRTVFESMYVSIGKKHGQTLFDKMVKAEALKPTLTLSKVLAVSLAIVVHGLTLIFAVLGVMLLLGGWPNPFALFIGLVCIGAAWVLFPRFSRPRGTIAARDKFPTLYQIVDDIAQALGTSRVAGIVIYWGFNAAFSQVGWQRKKILYLGLPLFSSLDGQEKVALLAHELAHGVNGDPNRSFFVDTAIDSLATWYGFLRPDGLIDHGPYGILTIPLNVFLLVLSGIVWLGIYFLSHLLWRDSQRAEYLADYLATTASSTEAMLVVLRKLYIGEDFAPRVAALLLDQEEQNLFNLLRQYVSNMPPRELERIRRVEQQAEFRLDATHPPTAYRIAFLKAHPLSHPKILLMPATEEQLERELKPIQEEMQRDVLGLNRPRWRKVVQKN